MARERIATLRVSISESARVQLLNQREDYEPRMTERSLHSSSRSSMSSSCSSSSSSTSVVPFQELEPSVTIGPMPIDNFMDEVAEIAGTLEHLNSNRHILGKDTEESLKSGERLKRLLRRESDPNLSVSNSQERALRNAQIDALRWRLADIIPQLELDHEIAYSMTRENLTTTLKLVVGEEEATESRLESLLQLSPDGLECFLAKSVRESRDYPTSRQAAIEAVELLRECHRIEVSWKALGQLSEDLRSFDLRVRRTGELGEKPKSEKINELGHSEEVKNDTNPRYSWIRRHIAVFYIGLMLLLAGMIICAILIPLAIVNHGKIK